jgi:hypothetical protein
MILTHFLMQGNICIFVPVHFVNKEPIFTPTIPYISIFLFRGTTAPCGPGPPHYQGFTITLRHTTTIRTPLVEWSAQHQDLYLTTHTTLTIDRNLCPSQDLNPQSQQASGRRPMLWTTRPLFYLTIFCCFHLCPGQLFTYRFTIVPHILTQHRNYRIFWQETF